MRRPGLLLSTMPKAGPTAPADARSAPLGYAGPCDATRGRGRYNVVAIP